MEFRVFIDKYKVWWNIIKYTIILCKRFLKHHVQRVNGFQFNEFGNKKIYMWKIFVLSNTSCDGISITIDKSHASYFFTASYIMQNKETTKWAMNIFMMIQVNASSISRWNTNVLVIKMHTSRGWVYVKSRDGRTKYA